MLLKKNQGTTDLICALQIMIETLIETKETAFITLIDYSKAFDNASHSQLFNIMIQIGFAINPVYLIKNFYVKQETRIQWKNWHTEPFSIGKGVKQGCILSLNLFSIYTVVVMCEAEVGSLGVCVAGRLFFNLHQAGYTALWINKHHEAYELIN